MANADINEKLIGRDINAEFDEALTRQGYEKEDRFDQRAALSGKAVHTSTAYLQKTHTGDNKGWENSYRYKAPKMLSRIFTSGIEEKKGLRSVDRIWTTISRIKKRIPKEESFHGVPLNRKPETMVANTEQAARVNREAVKYWPHCEQCKGMLYWGFVPAATSEEKIINWRDRMIFCDNPECSMCNKDIGLRASNLTFPDKEITRLFRKPFLTDIARRKRDLKKDIIRVPKNVLRSRSLKGLTGNIPSKKQTLVYHDETGYLDDGKYHD